MDSIDITDSAFSLNIPEVNEVISISTADNNMYIYIGVTILIVLIAIFVYKYYQTKNMSKDSSEMDCPGGFCTMNHNT